MEPSFHIIIINSSDKAISNRKLITNLVGMAFNQHYTAFAIDLDNVIVYSNDTMANYIKEILDDDEIEKWSNRPYGAIVNYFKGVKCHNYHNIIKYINNNGNSRLIPQFKQFIIDQDSVVSLTDRSSRIAMMILRYKMTPGNRPKNERSLYFNEKRECFLLYLTVYNDILSQYGPLTFNQLVNKVKSYRYLCRANMSPALALEGLVKIGALISDNKTTIITLP